MCRTISLIFSSARPRWCPDGPDLDQGLLEVPGVLRVPNRKRCTGCAERGKGLARSSQRGEKLKTHKNVNVEEPQ